MSQEFPLVTRLEKKIYELDRDREIAQKVINKNSILLMAVTAIEEYIVLKRDVTIPLGLRYLALSCIAKQYQLYQDEREISQLKDIVGREVDIPSHSEIFHAIQIIKDRYYHIYECNHHEFDRIERLVKEISPDLDEWGRNIDVANKPDIHFPVGDRYVSTNIPQIIITKSIEVTNGENEDTTLAKNKSILRLVTTIIFVTLFIGGTGMYITVLQQPQNEAVDLIHRWLEAKKSLFSPPFDQDSAASIMTGKAYRDKVKGISSNGTPDSNSEWLKKRGYYYNYGIQKIDAIKNFEASGNTMTIDVQITEDVNLYNSNGELQKKESGREQKTIKYTLVKENGILKISDSNTLTTRKIDQ